MRIDEPVVAAIRQALREAEGGILAFLPGVAEIERTAERLGDIPGAIIHKLHGSLDPAAQRAAIAPDPTGRRKIVLATSIAETSLTLDGIRVVVDSGLARRPRYDRAAGMTRLVTERASQASATQRAGRAARQGPGVAYRLWEAAATVGLPPYDPPEILEADLSALTLDCALWGVADPRDLRWLDPPPAAAVAEARARLTTLEALAPDGRPTAHGKAIAALPLPPRLGHMLVRAGELGMATIAAQVAVLLGERGLGGSDADLESRMRRWRSERGQRAEAAWKLAERWTKLAPAAPASTAPGAEQVALCIALAFPDSLFADRIETRRQVRFDPATGRVEATRERRLGAIRLSAGPDSAADPDEIAAALLAGVRAHGLALLPWSDTAKALRTRAAYAGLDALSDAALIADLDDWLPPLLAGKRRLDAVSGEGLTHALQNRIGWDGQKTLDRLAPARLETPAGSSHAIDYAAEGGPSVEVRVQALFGLAAHPMLGDGTPLVLSLTSPAGRPIQTTRDLPGFWKGSWADVAKEMRGRYPRHPWPDDPAAASATLRTKNADARRRGSG